MNDYNNILNLIRKLEIFFEENEKLNMSKIRDVIQKSLENSNLWFDKYGDLTSRINTHMYLLSKINELYNIRKYYNNIEFAKIMIEDTGLSDIGEHKIIKGKEFEIVDRYIGNNYSVNFVMKSADGEIFSYEFYD